MNERDQEQFEAELRRLAPARPPEPLMRRLEGLQFDGSDRSDQSDKRQPSGWHLWRWLAPAAALGAAALALALWRGPERETVHPEKPSSVAAEPPLKADEVEFDQQLVASFDAIARLPSGQPVRFRCREWTDALVLRDSSSGLVVEQRLPRLEVVPVRFETY